MPAMPAMPALHALHEPFSPAEAAPRPASAAIGRVQAIAVRPHGHAAPRAVDAVLARAGLGLLKDRHADPLSPRQVLLAGAPAYARHGLAPHTLRENLLLDLDTSHLASGTLLQVGAEAMLWLTFACEACRYLDARQPGIAAAIGRARGMLARVVRGGTIRVGDPVAVLEQSLPPWHDDWRARVSAILARVPPGLVVDYKQLARLAGVQSVYCRAFPRLARGLGYGDVAVPMAGQPGVARWEGEELFETQMPWNDAVSSWHTAARPASADRQPLSSSS